MPTYEYRCTDCGHQLEVLQKITEEPLKKCPECNQDTLKRGPGGGIGLSFQGTGFYITDYNKKPLPPSDSPQCCPCGKNKSSCDSSN